MDNRRTLDAPSSEAPSSPELVIFASPDDVGLGHMAAGWFSLLADPRKARAVLGNVRNTGRLPPHVAMAMRESGIDSHAVTARALTPALLTSADLVITMAETFDRGLLNTSVPLYREHWLIEPEPAHIDGPGRARSVRDLIRSRVAMLVFSEGWERPDISRDQARVTRPRWHADTYAPV